MSKVDLKKNLNLRHLYNNPSAKEVSVVDVPPMNFLMVDGAGDPNVALEYQQAIETLFSLSYLLKFRVKKSTGVDYTVMPLEGLWWTDDPSQFSMSDKIIWKWTVMIMQPDCVTAEMVAETLDEIKKKKNLVTLNRAQFETYHEGLAAQIMHIGPYDAEGPTIARLYSFIRENGYEPCGKHHEIYLSDPRKTLPEKLKTVLRQPLQKQG